LSPLTLTARDTAVLLGWLHRDGQGNSERVLALYRAGRFPSPIDPDLHPRCWVWSRHVIEQYAAGDHLPNDNEIQWEDPPPEAIHGSGWKAFFIAELRAHPGKWAKVPGGPRSGKEYSLLRARGLEVLTKRVEGNRYIAWARWPEIERWGAQEFPDAIEDDIVNSDDSDDE